MSWSHQRIQVLGQDNLPHQNLEGQTNPGSHDPHLLTWNKSFWSHELAETIKWEF